MAEREVRSAGQSASRHADFVAQLSRPVRQFLSTEQAGAVALLAATCLALLWANSSGSASYESFRAMRWVVGIGDHSLTGTVTDGVNDGLLTLFFFVIGLEVRREISIGELTQRRAVVLPIVAGAGGVLLPALVFLLLSPSATSSAWGAVIGTDTAFLLGAVALLGPRASTQLRLFLLTVTVIDDIVAVLVIGIVYSGDLRPWALMPALAFAVALSVLDRLGVRRAGPYAALAAALWAATVAAGLHASFAGMLAGLLIAGHRPDRRAVEMAAELFRSFRQSPVVPLAMSARHGIQQSLSVNERMLAALHPWTSLLVIPLFALVNAGVDLRGGSLARALTSPLTWAVAVSLVVGKFVGIGGSALLVQRVGWGQLPRGVGRGHVLGGAALSGIGFTVAILVIDLSLPDPALRAQAIVGVLLAGLLSALNGRAVFGLATRLGGPVSAALPVVLDRPVSPERDHIRGPAEAPMTLVEYGDFECPFCAKATGVAAELRERFGEDLRYVFRHLPLTAIHPHAELAARAALAAERQGRFWAMHDVLFANQDHLEPEDLLRYAEELDLDLDAFIRDMGEDAVTERLRDDIASAEASGARGTPTFFVNGRRHEGPYDAATLASRLKEGAGAAPTASAAS